MYEVDSRPLSIKDRNNRLLQQHLVPLEHFNPNETVDLARGIGACLGAHCRRVGGVFLGQDWGLSWRDLLEAFWDGVQRGFMMENSQQRHWDLKVERIPVTEEDLI